MVVIVLFIMIIYYSHGVEQVVQGRLIPAYLLEALRVLHNCGTQAHVLTPITHIHTHTTQVPSYTPPRTREKHLPPAIPGLPAPLQPFHPPARPHSCTGGAPGQSGCPNTAARQPDRLRSASSGCPRPRRCRPPGHTCARTQQLSALRLVNMAMRQPQHIGRLDFWPCRRPRSSRTHLASLTYNAHAPAKCRHPEPADRHSGPST